jgi:sugar phosphate isomerase/epimerase
VPGTGSIDFGPIFQAIRSSGYDGWITVELYPFIDEPDVAGRLAREFLLPLVRPS